MCSENDVLLTALRGSQGRDMKKWYRPLGMLLLATMIGELCGCAQTTGWLARKPTKKRSEEKLVDVPRKSRDKQGKGKSSKELANSKSHDSKVASASHKPKSKAVDGEHAKYASASDRVKKSKSATDPFAEDDSLGLAANSKSIKSKAKQVERNSDDELDGFLSKIESPTRATRGLAGASSNGDEFDPLNENFDRVKKGVVQVKKEIGKGVDEFAEDVSDWADHQSSAETKPVATAKSVAHSDSNSFDEDFASPSKGTNKDAEKKVASKDESADYSFDSLKKIGLKKVVERGLHTLCPDAEGELTTLLKDLDPNNPDSLKQGLHHISQMGSKGVAAAPFLQKMLKHDDSFVRTHAALAMSRLKLTSPESIKVVTDSLKSRDASLRSFGTAVLGEMGSQSKHVLANLSDNLNDRDGQVRLHAAEVLIRHDGYEEPALQSLLSCLKDKDDNLRWLAAYSLAELAPDAPEAVQALSKAAHDPVSKVRVGAVYALGEIGPSAKQSSGDLKKLLESSSDEELKSAITYSLQQMEK